MSIPSRIKKPIQAFSALTLIICTFLVHALAGLNSRPVKFQTPPMLVERYAARFSQSDSNGPVSRAADHSSKKLTDDYEQETALLHRIFFEGHYDSLDELLQLFRHPDKAQRVKIAAAFGELNIKYSHNDESGYPEMRKRFWVDVKDQLPNIQNALFEALIMSAQEGTQSNLPYTIAWMPGQGDRAETLEVLTWAAKHHPDVWVRRFSYYYVVEYGGNEKLASALLETGHYDPAYRVRKQALHSRYKRLTGQIEPWTYKN